MSRRTARELAFQMIFEYGFGFATAPEILERRMAELASGSLKGEADAFQSPPSDAQKPYLTLVMQGITGRMTEIDGLISGSSRGWKLERISRVSIAAMRLAVYEILSLEDVPTGVAVNEAVELVKQYDTEDAPAFVNGVLSGIIKTLASREEGGY